MTGRRSTRKKVVRSLDAIPAFASEDEEREWWATHDLSEELYDQLKAKPAELEAILPAALKKRRAVS